MVISVKVIPGASRDRVVGRYGDAIKVQVSAAPKKGKANIAVAKVLAKFFSIKPQQIELTSGPTNPHKQFQISGLDEATINTRLATLT